MATLLILRRVSYFIILQVRSSNLGNHSSIQRSNLNIASNNRRINIRNSLLNTNNIRSTLLHRVNYKVTIRSNLLRMNIRIPNRNTISRQTSSTIVVRFLINSLSTINTNPFLHLNRLNTRLKRQLYDTFFSNYNIINSTSRLAMLRMDKVNNTTNSRIRRSVQLQVNSVNMTQRRYQHRNTQRHN